VPLGLDPLREHDRAGPLRVGVDRVHDLGDRRAGPLLHQPQVELDHVGAQQRQEGQRHRLGADVVHGDAPAEAAHPLDRPQQLGRARRQRALGDLQHDPQLSRRLLGDREQLGQRSGAEHLRLDGDEHRQRRDQPGPDGAAEGGDAARAVQLGEPAGRAGGGEQRVGPLERALRTAGQRLVGDDGAGVELDDRLEDAADAAGGEGGGDGGGEGGVHGGEIGRLVPPVSRAGAG